MTELIAFELPTLETPTFESPTLEFSTIETLSLDSTTPNSTTLVLLTFLSPTLGSLTLGLPDPARLTPNSYIEVESLFTTYLGLKSQHVLIKGSLCFEVSTDSFVLPSSQRAREERRSML